MNVAHVFAAALLISTTSSAVSRDDPAENLLPGNIIPLHYRLHVFIDIDQFDENDTDTLRFTGEVTITFSVIEKNVTKIILHSYDTVDLSSVTITGNDGEDYTENFKNSN